MKFHQLFHILGRLNTIGWRGVQEIFGSFYTTKDITWCLLALGSTHKWNRWHVSTK